jgi:hypothetical protein
MSHYAYTNYSTIKLYTLMLANYATNSARTNHYILTYFKRLSSSRTRGGTISSSTATATDDDSGPTLEPLLYNIHTLSVFAALLEDPLIRLGAAKPTVDPTAKGGVVAEADGAPELRRLARYVADITRNFAALCTTNRLACVEALFLHQHPRRYAIASALNHCTGTVHIVVLSCDTVMVRSCSCVVGVLKSALQLTG